MGSHVVTLKEIYMGRKKLENYWNHVTKKPNGKWVCTHCEEEFPGSVTRVKAHLEHIKGGGIKHCPNYHMAGNEGVHNNMASISHNPQEPLNGSIHSIQVQGVPQMTDTVINGSVSPLAGSVSLSELEGVNKRSCDESVINYLHLHQLVRDLDFEESDIRNEIQWLETRRKKRKPKVDKWLENSKKLKRRAVDMENLEDIRVETKQLIQDMQFLKQTKPLTLSTEFVGETIDMNIQKVSKLLGDEKVPIIGIYGMGGVGKTTLATCVMNEIKKKATLKDVFWVTVSYNFSISKLQYDIAKRIGVKLDEDDERIRADNLSSALERKEKLVLILDDVWKYIDLQKVGIPLKVNGIKVILTTRLKNVCQQMDCLPNHMIEVVPLYDKDEDWELFKVKLGHNGTPATLSPEIEKIARHIVEKCDGLPLGICVMARIMKGVDDIHNWKHALNKLNKLEMEQEMEEEVFKVLKRSYDNLMEKDMQNCFLYCALLSHYYDCAHLSHYYDNRNEMIMKLVDNGLITGMRSLEEIFDKGNTILDKLESHSMMSFDAFYVHTHRMVIDMARYILKKSKKSAMVIFDDQCTNIPPMQEWVADLELVHLWSGFIKEIPEGMSPYCPILSTLIINGLSITQIPESFFKCMNNLSILDLSYNERLESLPNSVTKLTSLISLVLKGCVSLKHVPPLEKLQALSRLDISNSLIEKAPQGLEKLVNLIWLDPSQNLNLELGCSLSNLMKMQYLDLRHTLAIITVEDVQGMHMLECVGGFFDCKHYNNMQKMLDTSFWIKTYHLFLRNVCGESSVLCKYINLKRFVPGDPKARTIQFGDCEHFTHILPKDLTCMYIHKNIHWVCLCDALSSNDSSSLRRIEISTCKQLESLFCLSCCCSFCTKIHNLEILKLSSLESLTAVFKDVDVGHSLSPGSVFSCLKKFSIHGCHLIVKLLTPRIVLQLQNLETITVRNCDSVKEIFEVSNNDDDDSSSITLPKLTRLELYGLPQLKIVCKGSIRCGSSLPKLAITFCPSLERHPTIEIKDVEIPAFFIFFS